MDNKLFIWVFIPYYTTEEGLDSHYDTPTTLQQLADVFAELGLEWKWQPITFENMHAVVEEVATVSKEYTSVVLNYCDGDDLSGYPGVSLVKLLEAKNIIFTGANSDFYELSTDKILMKRAFVEAGVSTAAYEVIGNSNQVQGVCDRLGSPLIVKPAISCASCGISVNSVVHNDEQVSLQIQRMRQGLHGWEFPPDGIYVEKFLNGAEFTVFLVGSVNQPENIKVYPPTQRVFYSILPELERFLSYDKVNEIYEEETPPPAGEVYYHYKLVEPILANQLCDLSSRVYCAVGGTGYARVDIRMDKESQKLFVLEVNANCGISPNPESGISPDDETPIGNILQLSGIPFTYLMADIIAEALASKTSNQKILTHNFSK